MADLEKMNRVNAELNAMVDEMTRQRENPRIVRLAQIMADLTDTGANAQHSAKPAESVPAAAQPDDQAQEHVHQLNVYGKCVSCDYCQHQKVVAGECLVCGAKVD